MGVTAEIAGCRILVVAEDSGIGHKLESALSDSRGVEILFSQDSDEIVSIASEGGLDLAIIDIEVQDIDCWKLVPRLIQDFPETQVIIIAGRRKMEKAVHCLRAGAAEYLIKPVSESRLLTAVTRALEQDQLRKELAHLKDRVLSRQLAHPQAFAEIITGNSKMWAIFQYVEAFAATSYPAVITGETGVGKELIARAIHKVSGRKGAFLAVNVAGLDDNMFTDTLFGHRVGAFTGADKVRAGIIEKAAGGTLFLDEIGDLGPGSQVKLLRLLQEKEYYPLGSDEPKRSDARIIVATNQDLDTFQEEGRFRKDLYYRLRSHHVNVPPLRERKDDLPLLLDYFLEKTAAELDKKKPTPPAELITLLSNYHFPGNVRELEVMARDAVASHASGVLSMNVFRKAIGDRLNHVHIRNGEFREMAKDLLAELRRLPTMHQMGDLLIAEALRRSDGNQSIAAQLIGVSRQTLNRRLKAISPPPSK